MDIKIVLFLVTLFLAISFVSYLGYKKYKKNQNDK